MSCALVEPHCDHFGLAAGVMNSHCVRPPWACVAAFHLNHFTATHFNVGNGTFISLAQLLGAKAADALGFEPRGRLSDFLRILIHNDYLTTGSSLLYDLTPAYKSN